MARSTQAQKARRLNAAYRLLTQGMSTAQAAAMLSRDGAISRRQAYRYLEQARQLNRPLEVVEAARPITLKVPADVIRALRAYAAANELTLSEVVTRAVREFLGRAGRRG